ncbi:hypothetical protein PanWU01x14_189720 [Parasponia andersonii]|uniref:Uncharacterized protein n=1 Tax=Parasponia andersonii TaxID=3476 RepID=A0A2P5C2J1_PARAD|nr:hypothetical protein PanWU01x14_189720 [Parasponia andersonii]
MEHETGDSDLGPLVAAGEESPRRVLLLEVPAVVLVGELMWVLGDRPYREKGPSGLGSEARRVSSQKWGWDEKERASSSTSCGSLRKEKGYHGKNHRKKNWDG